MNRLSLRDGKLSYAIHGLAERHYSVFEKLWRSDIEWEFGPSLVGLVDKWLEKAPQDMQADMCSWALEQGFYKIDGPLANKIDTVLEANIFAYKEICSSSVISLPYRIKFHLIWERKEAQTEKEQAINLEIGNYLFSEISSGNIKDISERTCKYLIRTSWAWRLFASNRSKTTELRTKALALILKDENLIAKFSKDGRSNVRRGFKTDIKRFIKNQDVDLPARIKAAVLLQREDLELPAKPLIEELKRKSWKSFGEPQVKDIAEFLGLDEKLTGKLVKIHKRAIRTNYDFRNAFKGILTFSEQAGLSFPEAFETIESLMRILPNKKFRIIDITKKALSQIPKGETLSDLRSKYPAIPLDTFCQCICFVNGMERQRVLANFNTVFSAKKIRKAVTKKLAIRKALTNIYLSGSKNNMKAVIELLLMVEEGFGKSQQSPFIEALGYIESLGEFGDLIDNIKKRTAHAEG